MVATCHGLGYEYIAITDHSEHAAAFRTVDRDDLERQRDEIALLQDEFPGMTILRGIEADILADGRIDCDETTMASLDIVLASLHERHGDDGRRLTGRMLKAIRHPLVSVITHPQNQIVGHRDPYDLDFAAVYEAAAETGTILEIDGAPAHLDLDGPHSRDAIAHGVTVSIDSDCHRAVQLDRQMTLGIGIARRGRVEARHVLNTRPLQDVRAFIGRKRARGEG
jgi:DNA polymerase (family 10)